MDKQLLGQPLWVWAVGAVVVVGGVWYFKNHAASSSSSAAGQPSTGQPTDLSNLSFFKWLVQHQGGTPTGTPAPPKKKHHKKKKG